MGDEASFIGRLSKQANTLLGMSGSGERARPRSRTLTFEDELGTGRKTDAEQSAREAETRVDRAEDDRPAAAEPVADEASTDTGSSQESSSTPPAPFHEDGAAAAAAAAATAARRRPRRTVSSMDSDQVRAMNYWREGVDTAFDTDARTSGLPQLFPPSALGSPALGNPFFSRKARGPAAAGQENGSAPAAGAGAGDKDEGDAEPKQQQQQERQYFRLTVDGQDHSGGGGGGGGHKDSLSGAERAYFAEFLVDDALLTQAAGAVGASPAAMEASTAKRVGLLAALGPEFRAKVMVVAHVMAMDVVRAQQLIISAKQGEREGS